MSHEGILNCLPFPRITLEQEVLDGLLIDAPEFCKTQCADKECSKYQCGEDSKVCYHTCPYGYSVIAGKCGGVEIRVCGVLHLDTSSADKLFRKSNRDRKISSEAVARLFKKLDHAIRLYEDDIRLKSRDELASIHEIKAQISVVFRIVENHIHAQYGGTIDSRIEVMDPVWKNLQSAIRRLKVLLELTDLVVNPQAASFGRLINTQVHQTVYSIMKTIEAKAHSANISLTICGTSYNTMLLYKSFPIAVSVLLDNAIKYAQSGTEVVITVNDVRNYGVDIQVSSIGLIVPEADRQFMFEKNARGSNSMGKEGSGVGLYVAKLVCDANKAIISYDATEYPSLAGYGENLFSIKLRS